MEYHLMCLWNFLLVVLCVPDEEAYTVHLNPLSFDKALESCQPRGYLTKIASEEEASKILKVISDTVSTRDPFEFWVGLKKSRQGCVQLEEPLKGFKWTVDDSSVTDLDRWNVSPQSTCTGVLCVHLFGKFNDTHVEDWGLVSGVCKKERPFICKQDMTEECPTPHIPEAKSLRADPSDNRTLNLECRSGEVFKLICPAKTLIWERSDGSVLDGICASCEAGYEKDDYGDCVDINECLDRPCKYDCVNAEGSYRCKCFGNGGEFNDSAECNETQKTTATSKRSKAHLSQDQNPTPQPTNERLFLSSPSDSNTPTIPTTGVDTEVKGDVDLFIPVLIAVILLAFLLVVVLAIAMFCRARRSKKLPMKSTDEESMKKDAASNRDSLENSKETEVI